MPYSTQAEILQRIPEEVVIQLTDDESIGAIVTARVDAAIARADQEIDAWCGKRYSVPFAEPPAIVSGLSADMAIYFLYARTQEEVPKTRDDGYKAAVKLLQAISKGDVSLGVDPAPASPTGGGASFISGDRLFSRNKLKGLL